MYRADRPLGISLIAMAYLFPGLWLMCNAVFAVPFGLCFILLAPQTLSGGMWMTILGVSQFALGLATWTGHRVMRSLVVVGPVAVIALSLLSGLTNNGWSAWTVLLSIIALVYFQTDGARHFLNSL